MEFVWLRIGCSDDVVVVEQLIYRKFSGIHGYFFDYQLYKQDCTS
jgi:hypothetical protein